MENKFQREERYLVIKTKDIAHLSDADRQMLRHLLPCPLCQGEQTT